MIVMPSTDQHLIERARKRAAHLKGQVVKPGPANIGKFSKTELMAYARNLELFAHFLARNCGGNKTPG